MSVICTCLHDSKMHLMSVPVSPDVVTLRGPTEARLGERLTYECETSASNPPAAITWTVGNETRQSLHEETVESPATGGWISRASVTVSLEEGSASTMVVCSATNAELNEVKSEAKMLSVICEYKRLLRSFPLSPGISVICTPGGRVNYCPART